MIIYNKCTNNVQETFNIADQFAQKELYNYCTNHSFNPVIIYLIGDLGSGKTTFIRGILKSFGYKETVKSPTYTIVETYMDLKVPIYHFDLYRLLEPNELELIGIRDYLQDGSLCFFEWPDKGAGHIPEPDFIIEISLTSKANARNISIKMSKS